MSGAPLDSAPRVHLDLPLAIDPDEVRRFAAYGGRPAAETGTRLHEVLALAAVLVTPRAATRWLPVERREPGRLVAGGRGFTIPGVGTWWGEVEWVAAVVCTIGDALERRVAELGAGLDPGLAPLLDAAGSGAVESLAEHVNDLLCQEGVAHRQRVTNRLSPGYGDWDRADQRPLFRLCPGTPIGVTLDAALIMRPAKSLSFLVGAGPAARVDHYASQCARCWAETCPARRTPARGRVHR